MPFVEDKYTESALEKSNQPHIYALLVGINKYPVKTLGGCINDVNAVEYYLQKTYGKARDITLDIKRITDDDLISPTRENIIVGFDHFNSASDNDICLFYYSGHGSSYPVPEESWSEAEMSNDSFVCIDSRLPGGRDLMYKELGYLIWKTMTGKNHTRFILITDCCHRGLITRNIDFGEKTDRMMPGAPEVSSIEEYLGYGSELKGIRYYNLEKDELSGKIEVTFQQSNYIHLTASRDDQMANELNIDGVTRGAFTHSLLKTLESRNGKISYQDLIKQTGRLLKNFAHDQQPALSIYGNGKTGSGSDFFLTPARAEMESVENYGTELPGSTPLPRSKPSYQISLYSNRVAGRFDSSNFEKVGLQDSIADFRYHRDGSGEWHQPAFQLSIKNTGKVPLWVSNAYIGFDHEISTEVFEDIDQLAPGNEAWLKLADDEYKETAVLLHIDDKYSDQGYNEITEYLKLFISTQPIDTDKLNVDALAMSVSKTRSGNDRIYSSDVAPNQSGISNYYTETIGFRIIGPARKNLH